MRKRLFAILLALVMVLGLAVTAAADKVTDLNALLDKKTGTDSAVNVVFGYGESGVTFSVTVTGYVLNGGNYKLTGDLTITAPLVIQGTVTLDLNGHVLKYENSEKKNSVIVVDDGASFTLKDSGSGGKITGGTGTKYEVTESPTESWVRGGGVFVGSKATFNMSGGSIEGCSTTGGDNDKGGGVYLASGHNENLGANINYTTFNMTGGSIRNCRSGQGGGVCTGAYANITIENSEISGCEAADSGGGVGVGGASNILSMTNSTISNCTATVYGGGVSTGNSSGDGTFTMENSSITNCTAQIGGGVYNDCGYFTMKDGSTISGCKAIFDPATIGERFHGGGGVYIREEVFTMEAGSVISGCTSSDGKSDSLNLGTESHCYMHTYGGSVYGSVYNRNCDIENTATDGSTIFYGEITNVDRGKIVGKRVTFMNGDTLYAETVANENGNGKISVPDAPTAAGKHFSGWYTAQSGGTKWEFATDTVSSNMTLYAQWGCAHTGGDWQFDSSSHWKVCTICGETYAEAAHDGSPCTVCGYEQPGHEPIRRQHVTAVEDPTNNTDEAKTDVVASPKTFDTGVAVYGAMAIASLLGMGYVGKKRV